MGVGERRLVEAFGWRVVLRVILIAGLLAVLACGGFALATQSCPAGLPVSSFKLIVEPAATGTGIPIASVNLLERGEKLRYEPVHVPPALKKKAKVAVILVSAGDEAAGGITVLAPRPVEKETEWAIPVRASVVGVMFGPHGLDPKRVKKLVEQNPELISQLTDYADKTTKVEALVKTLSDYEQAPPGGISLQGVLHGFSSQYGVMLPKIDPATPPDQEANTLLHAIVPAFSPAGNSKAGPGLAAQSTGLATSIASLFFGSPVNLAAGGVALIQNLHSSLFPPTLFRPAFTQKEAADGLTLCSAAKLEKTHGRITYLWMLRVPNAKAPEVSLQGEAHLPLGWNGTIKATCGSRAQLKLLPRAQHWSLISPHGEVTVPVTVTAGESDDELAVDLRHSKLTAGQYQLAGKWDWGPMPVKGTVDILPIGDLSNVKLTDDSQDRLVSGKGKVSIALTGADFEFVRKVTLQDTGHSSAKAVDLPFVLPKEKKNGQLAELLVSVDTDHLAAGKYHLELEQVNHVKHEVNVEVHPPMPALTQLPLRVNTGQTQQTILLRGTGLERIVRITGSREKWTLEAVKPDVHNLTERAATIRLDKSASVGSLLSADVFVEGIHKPMHLAHVLKVAGPRPKVVDVKRSMAGETGVELTDGEIPAGIEMSFALQVEHVDARPKVRLACADDGDALRKVAIMPGEKIDGIRLDSAGQGVFYLSLDPGRVGQSGCSLMAAVTDEATGTSDPVLLGRIIGLPVIDKFTTSEDKLGDALYAGALTGKDLQLIEKTGWSDDDGHDVRGIPTPVPGAPGEQTLSIAVPWPPPSPKAPLYVWLRGEKKARKTNAHF